MARNNGKRSSGMRNLRSAGWTAAKFTGRTTEKAAVGLFRWATTDHYGTREAFDRAAGMGFLEGLKYILLQLVIAIVAAALTGLWIGLLIAFGIPFLLTGHF